MDENDIDMNGACLIGVYRDGMWTVAFRFPDGRNAIGQAEDLVSATRLASYKAAPEFLAGPSN